MKQNLYRMFIARCLVAAVLCVCGTISGIYGVPGWGWFLFGSLVAIPSVDVYRECD